MADPTPHLLPYALPKRLGLPYHGLVTNGRLALPGGGTMAYPQPDTGDTNIVRHSLASAPATDPGRPDYIWQNHAILSGSGKEIGSKALGPSKWIYCDSAAAWVISASVSASSTTVSVTISLEKPFGLIRDKQSDLAMPERVLATYAFPFLKYNGDANLDGDYSGLLMTHSETGAITAINVVTVSTLTYSYEGTQHICHSFKVVVSGDGDLTPGTIGAGISASCSRLADAPDMFDQEKTVSGTSDTLPDLDYWLGVDPALPTWEETPVPSCPPGGGTVDYYAESNFTYLPGRIAAGNVVATTTTTWTYFYCVTPGGAIVSVVDKNTDVTTNINKTVVGDLPQAVKYYGNLYNIYSSNCLTLLETGAYSYGIDGSAFYAENQIGSSWSGSRTISFGSYTTTASASNSAILWQRYTWTPSTAVGWTYVLTKTDGSTLSPGGLPTMGVSIATNNVVLCRNDAAFQYVSILGDTEARSKNLVSWNPETRQFAQNADQVCWV
jgi:hypothetical protein